MAYFIFVVLRPISEGFSHRETSQAVCEVSQMHDAQSRSTEGLLYCPTDIWDLNEKVIQNTHDILLIIQN